MRKLCYSLIFQRYYPSQSVKEVFESKKDGFASFFMELCQMICFTCSFPMHCTFPEKGNACLNQQILSLLWEKKAMPFKKRAIPFLKKELHFIEEAMPFGEEVLPGLKKALDLNEKAMPSAYQGGKRSGRMSEERQCLLGKNESIAKKVISVVKIAMLVTKNGNASD